MPLSYLAEKCSQPTKRKASSPGTDAYVLNPTVYGGTATTRKKRREEEKERESKERRGEKRGEPWGVADVAGADAPAKGGGMRGNGRRNKGGKKERLTSGAGQRETSLVSIEKKREGRD